ncbi:MAG: hypothetical protein DRP01_04220 [Archaeoglobales archaeon]|nr:MAG: hypothetical protein DRP01_04220 [Archaeoglobales archaeon]
MSKFWELFEKSIIVQGSVTFIVVATACYLFVTTGDIPEALSQILGLILGFWFGTYTQKQIQGEG